MNVLVIGSGGREHALVWKILQSKRVKKVYCAPGNGGTAAICENVPIEYSRIGKLIEFAKSKSIDLTVVGPEAPLVAGIVDRFNQEGLSIFGPSRLAARLEGSKVFAKNIMKQNGIPTADFKVFSEYGAAEDYIRSAGTPIVIKADGLAAGKGVFVARTADEACKAAHSVLEQKIFGDAGNKIIVEDCLEGEEASILAFTDGKNIMLLESSQDHKAVYDGDKGPNTGGMGAYSPAPVITPDIEDTIIKDILIPVIHGMNFEGCPYSGILYAGLMIQNGEPSVLEFNVRLGDPETQPLLVRLKSDLVDLIEATANGTLDRENIEWNPDPAVCVVMASGGYPGTYEKGMEISGIEDAETGTCQVFHAGTELKDGKTVTSGGRVLGVTATGSGIKQAISNAYAGVEKVSFTNDCYRSDIGAKALNRT